MSDTEIPSDVQIFIRFPSGQYWWFSLCVLLCSLICYEQEKYPCFAIHLYIYIFILYIHINKSLSLYYFLWQNGYRRIQMSLLVLFSMRMISSSGREHFSPHLTLGGRWSLEHLEISKPRMWCYSSCPRYENVTVHFGFILRLPFRAYCLIIMLKTASPYPVFLKIQDFAHGCHFVEWIKWKLRIVNVVSC